MIEIQTGFSTETRKALAANNWVIYEPFRTTIADLEQAHKPFSCIVAGRNPFFRTLLSEPSEVAILPSKFYVPDSNNLPISIQKEILAEDLAGIVKGEMGVPDVQAIIADAPTYAAAAFRYLETEGKWLFGDSFLRTITQTVCYDTAIVGIKRHGLALISQDRRKQDPHTAIARLLIPA